MTAGIILERSLDMLELLVDHPEGLPLSDIARTLDIPKSATHRILSILAKRAYVEQKPGLERYSLNLKLSTLGFRLIARTNVLDVCQPVLDRLAQQTGEFVRLALWDGSSLTWVAKAQGAQWGLRYDPDMHFAVVLHATASGRAWLVTLDEDQAVAFVNQRGFAVPDRFGPQRVTSESELITELRLTKKRGYGLAIEECEPGTAAVALAIAGGERRKSPGTISVAGPVMRMSNTRLKEIVPLLKHAADELAELWPLMRMRSGTAD